MYGAIYDSFNSPLTSVTVEAYDKDLRLEKLPGSTGAMGAYNISYTTP